jgi:hypothetical protein
MTRSVSVSVLVSLALFGAVTIAAAADLPLPGNRINLIDTPRGDQQSLVGMVSTGVDLAGIDPTVAGATLSIFTPSSGHLQTVDLPAVNWTKSESARDLYRYLDRADRSVRATIAEDGAFRITVRGPASYALDGVQSEVVARLAIGGTRFCVVFGGTIRRDDGIRFVAVKSPAPASCPLAPGETTTTTSTTTTSTTGPTLPSRFLVIACEDCHWEEPDGQICGGGSGLVEQGCDSRTCAVVDPCGSMCLDRPGECSPNAHRVAVPSCVDQGPCVPE